MKYIKSSNTNRQKCYNVEFIITRKIKGKKKFYLIKWEGYPITDCSWEPISHLSNVNDMVREFDDNFPNSIKHRYLKQFKLKLKKYKQQKKIEKIKKFKKIKKNSYFNKIIIELDDDKDLNLIDNEKEKDETKMECNLIFEKMDIEDKNEKIVNTTDNDINNYFKNDGKLIRPVLIW